MSDTHSSKQPGDSRAKRPADRTGSRRAPRVGVAAAIAAIATLLLGLGGYAFFASDAGVAFVLRELANRSSGALTIEGVSGSLLETIRARRITWQGETARFVANDVALSWTPSALWSRGVVVNTVDAKDVVLELETSATDVNPPASLALPFEVTLDRVAAERLAWRVGPNRGTINGLTFGYRGGGLEHRVTALELSGETWKLTGSAGIGATAPFPMTGELRLQGARADLDGAARIGLAGTLSSLALDGQGTVNGTRLSLQAALAPLAAVPLRSVNVDASEVDLSAWLGSSPATRIDVSLDARPDGEGINGAFAATNHLAGPIDAGKLPLRAAKARFAWRETMLALDDIDARTAGGGSAQGSARIPLTGEAGAGKWSLVLSGIDLASIQTSLIATRLAGRVDAELKSGRQRFTGDVRDQAIAGGIALDFAADVANGTVTVERLRARASGGMLEGRGRLALSADRAFSLEAVTTRLDPARFGAFPKGALDVRISASGTAGSALRSTFELGIADGSRLQGVPVSGRAAGEVTGTAVRNLNLAFEIAGARIAAEGSAGAAEAALTATLDAPRLAALAPLWPGAPGKLAGSLFAKGRWQGPWPRGSGELRVSGAELALGSEFSARALELDFKLGAVPSEPDLLARVVGLDATATGVKGPQGLFHAGRANVSGTFAAHTLTLGLDGDDVGLKAEARGGLALTAGSPPRSSWRWVGTLARLDGRGPLGLSLKAPARVEFAPDVARLVDAQLAIAEGTLRIDEFAWDQGRITTRGAVASVPLATVARVAGTPLPFGSTLTVGGDWSVAATPRLNGTVNLRRQGGDLQLEAHGQAGTPIRVTLGLTRAEVVARLNDDAISATGSLLAADGGSVNASLDLGVAPGALPGRIGLEAPLAASAAAELPTLQLLRPWIGTSAVLSGRARADVKASGTLAKASLAGSLAADALRLDAPPYGVSFKDGRLRARLAEGRLTLDEFAVNGGAGEFRASGTIAAPGAGSGTSAQIGWRASRFRLLNRPDLNLTVEGEGTLTVAQEKLVLTGNLKALDGNIAYESDPESTLGPDVVVKGWAPAAAPGPRPTDLPLAVDLMLDLGNRLHFAGEGLDTGLRGTVRITTGPRGLNGKGSIRSVNGTYRAFGQKLSIDPGRLIFDGPLDNPGLDIVALRKNLAVEAGVAVTGSVRVPVIRLTSEPPVSDSEKLSWLVLGHGLDRSSGPDLSALQAASALLLGRNSKPITTAIAETVGVDDISFKPAPATGRASSNLQGGVVAIGKRLTNRLSLIYEQGMTVANSAVKLEYALNRNVTLRASTGVVSDIGIQFQKSFE